MTTVRKRTVNESVFIDLDSNHYIVVRKMLNPLTAKALIAYVDRLRIEVGNASESLLKRINFCYRLVVSKKIQELKYTV